MYVFATPYARRNAFNAFWNTHNLYIFLYIFMIMHGLGRLVQAPITHTYLIGPLFIYIIDKLISLSRKKIECRVVKAELLPSGEFLRFLYSYSEFQNQWKLSKRNLKENLEIYTAGFKNSSV